jgi:hypothetical protein
MPAPLHCALSLTVPDGSDTSRLEVPVAVGAEQRACLQDALQDGFHGQLLADPSGRRERDLGRIHSHGERRRALRLGGIVQPAGAGGGIRTA